MSFRRRLMMAQRNGEEPIDWDYEWYPPEEKPSWLSTQMTGEMGTNYYRVPVYTGGSAPNKPFITFSSSEFPSGKSYIVEIDVEEMAMRAHPNSSQASIQFFSTAGGTPRIVRATAWQPIPGTNYTPLGFNTTNAWSGDMRFTDDLRFKIRIDCDTVTPKFTLKIGEIALSSTQSLLPSTIYSRYITADGYWDIYSIKVKVIDNI